MLGEHFELGTGASRLSVDCTDRESKMDFKNIKMAQPVWPGGWVLTMNQQGTCPVCGLNTQEGVWLGSRNVIELNYLSREVFRGQSFVAVKHPWMTLPRKRE